MNDDSLKSPPLFDGATSAKQSGSGQKPLVVIFSKEEDTRLLFRTFLQMSDYQIEGANNFDNLLSIVQKQHPAVILMDSVFPFEENLTIIRSLRNSIDSVQPPVIMISGFAQPRFRQLALSAGANEYLIKPVNFDALENSIKKYTTQIVQ